MSSFTCPNSLGFSRRDVLRGAAHGFGAIALQHLLARDGLAARVNPLAVKQPHFESKIKSVIFLFMVGAPSPVDLFDPKPALQKFAGQKLPDSYGKVTSQFTNGEDPLLPSPWKFAQYGQGGVPVSTLMPHLAKCVDDICFVPSALRCTTPSDDCVAHGDCVRTNFCAYDWAQELFTCEPGGICE